MMYLPRLFHKPASRNPLSLLKALLGSALLLPGQVLMTGGEPGEPVRLHPSDMAIFLAGENRSDLPCSVSPNKPVLGFDMRLHSTYEVAVPLAELAGDQDILSLLFRVQPVDPPGEPAHFVQRVRVPPIDEGARGDAYLHGTFDVGPGDYRVSWLMRDRSGRVCSSFWDVRAGLAGKDQEIELNLRPGRVAATELEQFREEPPVLRRAGGENLSVKVMVNFAPQNQHAATLRPIDTSALVSILRTISREPRITKFSVVTFNLHERRVLYRQENADRIDFPAIGASLETLELGTIDIARLSDEFGEAAFLSELIRQEVAGDTQPDALIFAGPKAMLTRNIPEQELEAIGQLPYPVYYMNYNLNPFEIPWRDAIGVAVHFLNGREYTITRPRDLFVAVGGIVSEIVKGKDNRRMAAAASE